MKRADDMNTKSAKELYRRVNGICKCGAPLSTEVLFYLNLSHASSLKKLGQHLSSRGVAECQVCGERYELHEPLALDLPREATLYVLVPHRIAYRAFACISEAMSALGSSELTLQPYFTQAELAIGSEALRKRLLGESSSYDIPMSRDGERPQKLTSSKTAVDALNTAKTPRPLTPLPFPRGSGLKPKTTPLPLSAVTSPLPQSMSNTPSPGSANPTLAQEMAEAQTKVSRIHRETSSTEAREIGGLDSLLDSALNEGEAITSISEINDGGLSDFHRADTAVTSQGQSSEDVVTHNYTPRGADLERIERRDLADTHKLYTPNMRQFDQQLARGNSRYITLREDRVEIAAKIDERYAERWITGELDVRIQLHVIDLHGAPCLSLFTVEDGEIQDELYWPIQVDDQRGPQILRALRKRFQLELTLFKKNHNFYGQRLIESPLEENTAYIINRIKQMRMTHSAAARTMALVTAEDYDRDGQLKHPFSQDSFSEIKSAQSALLAVGIWSYWSTVKQRDYLIFNKSFPILWLRRLQHRVLKGALEFGIAMPQNLQSQAVALGLAKSDVELLQKTIAHFVEVNIQLRASELDPDEVWENWEALLTQLDDLGIDADEEVEQLAFQAMQRVGVDLELEEEPEVDAYTMLPDPVSIDDSLDDASDVNDLEVVELVDGSDLDVLSGGQERREDTAISADPAPLGHANEGQDHISDGDSADGESSDASADEEEPVELIGEGVIEDDQLADEGEPLLLLDDEDIVEEEILDMKTAELGALLLAENASETAAADAPPLKTQVLVSASGEDDEPESEVASAGEDA